ncbi:MAG: ABC transporter ATP-binding protein [Eubacterium sp.]|nr:ABC transporter ATP-binding protein [Eubacterium sp.]
MSETILKFENVRAGYGDREILKGFSAEIARGEFVGLIGANGTGKSTLLKCLSGLLPVASGRISIEGQDNAGLKQRERARMVAVVPQSFAIDYDFLVEEIVLMGRNPYLSYRDRESSRDYAIVEAAMRLTGTLGFKGRLFNELSGGEKQRVIIARAIAQEPDIILLDEPTSALDLHHQIEVMELIEHLNRDRGVTVVAVLHDVNLASRYCGRLIMMQGGRVLADGRPSEVVVEENLAHIYQMKMVVRENPMFGKPEIVPIRVLKPGESEVPLSIHVIGGGGGAAQILEALDDLGHEITAGVLNEGSDDWLVARALGLEMITAPPFTEISEQKQAENLKLMAQADVVLVAEVPFGLANLRNLEGLETVPGSIFFHKSGLKNDFTQGALTKRLRAIEAVKDIVFIDDYEQFLEALGDIGKEREG